MELYNTQMQIKINIFNRIDSARLQHINVDTTIVQVNSSTLDVLCRVVLFS